MFHSIGLTYSHVEARAYLFFQVNSLGYKLTYYMKNSQGTGCDLDFLAVLFLKL